MEREKSSLIRSRIRWGSSLSRISNQAVRKGAGAAVVPAAVEVSVMCASLCAAVYSGRSMRSYVVVKYDW